MELEIRSKARLQQELFEEQQRNEELTAMVRSLRASVEDLQAKLDGQMQPSPLQSPSVTSSMTFEFDHEGSQNGSGKRKTEGEQTVLINNSVLRVSDIARLLRLKEKAINRLKEELRLIQY